MWSSNKKYIPRPAILSKSLEIDCSALLHAHSPRVQYDTTNANQTIAAFLIARTASAWLGWGWVGCVVRNIMHAKMCRLYSNQDYRINGNVSKSQQYSSPIP